MAKYRVTRRGSILGDKGVIYRAGQPIPDGTFNSAQIKEFLSTGFLVEVGAEADYGVDPNTIPAKSEIDLRTATGKKEMTTQDNTDPAHVTAAQKLEEERKQKAKATGKWSFDPKILKDKTLEELNTLVIETDAEVKPFNTKKEAIAQLSLEHVEG